MPALTLPPLTPASSATASTTSAREPGAPALAEAARSAHETQPGTGKQPSFGQHLRHARHQHNRSAHPAEPASPAKLKAGQHPSVTGPASPAAKPLAWHTTAQRAASQAAASLAALNAATAEAPETSKSMRLRGHRAAKLDINPDSETPGAAAERVIKTGARIAPTDLAEAKADALRVQDPSVTSSSATPWPWPASTAAADTPVASTGEKTQTGDAWLTVEMGPDGASTAQGAKDPARLCAASHGLPTTQTPAIGATGSETPQATEPGAAADLLAEELVDNAITTSAASQKVAAIQSGAPVPHEIDDLVASTRSEPNPASPLDLDLPTSPLNTASPLRDMARSAVAQSGEAAFLSTALRPPAGLEGSTALDGDGRTPGKPSEADDEQLGMPPIDSQANAALLALLTPQVAASAMPPWVTAINGDRGRTDDSLQSAPLVATASVDVVPKPTTPGFAAAPPQGTQVVEAEPSVAAGAAAASTSVGAPAAKPVHATANPVLELETAQFVAVPAPSLAVQPEAVARAAEQAALSSTAAPFEATIDPALDTAAFAPALGARIAVLARDGIEQARLNVHPADMGPITVQLALDGTQVRVDFSAEMAATRQTLEQAMPSLAASLREAGFTLSGGGVSQQASQGSAQPDANAGGAAASSSASSRSALPESGDQAARAGTRSNMRREKGLVDVFA